MTARLPTRAQIERIIKAALAAGLQPQEVRQEPDGTVRVIVSGGSAAPLNEWDAV